MRDYKIIGSIMTLLGLVMLAIALSETVEVRKFQADTALAEGVVYQIVRYDNYHPTSTFRKRYSYAPVVEWMSPEGHIRYLTTEVSYDEDVFIEGDVVTVIYKKDNPENARLYDFFNLWLGPLLAAVIGLSFLGFGLYLLREYLRTRMRNARDRF